MLTMTQLRERVGAADPAREFTDPTAPVPPSVLIGRAESTADAAALRPRRSRLMLVNTSLAAGVAVVAAIALVVSPGTPPADPPPRPPLTGGGAGLSPIAYEITSNPPAAGDELRKLADRVGPAPYDARTGKYTFVHVKSWDRDPLDFSEGEFSTWGDVTERSTWLLPDGSGTTKNVIVDPHYPDAASRDYWAAHPVRTVPAAEPSPDHSPLPEATGQDTSTYITAKPGPVQPEDTASPRVIEGGTGPVAQYQEVPAEARRGPLPTDRAGIERLLQVSHGQDAVAGSVNALYSERVVPQETRVLVLRTLADVPGFKWRGSVTDRAGRKGVAITAEQEGWRWVLIFDPATGAMLSSEMVADRSLGGYRVILEVDRTDRIG